MTVFKIDIMRICLIIGLLCCSAFALSAQVDSTLWYRNIAGLLREPGSHGNRVTLVQPPLLDDALLRQVSENEHRKLEGYRLRIYWSNLQNARNMSQTVLDEFVQHYPEVAAYRSFDSPYYKVSVGNFRSRSEAVRFQRKLPQQYRSAFIIKEAIAYPE